ncbi:MAG TPA: 3-hydroxyacyl-CoA dehydrogenase [Hyphomicrobiales bacterium]|nr:3-hydroxyacyl-CoA dehydrogenase [Hyphomicrobiales bacterium]
MTEDAKGIIAIIGAGLIGRAWAVVFSRAGWDVRLSDPDESALAAAPALIRKELQEITQYGLAAEPEMAASRVSAASSVAEAVQGASFVQESGPETIDAKRAIFAELDGLASPDAILSSSTSAIMPSLFTEGLQGRHRCLVSHPVNPPHLVPIVELCGAPWTAPATLARAKEVFSSVGQVPITINREVDGFIVNRLQGALLAEAFRLVGEGFVSSDDLDHAMKNGLGLRWSFMGPFETIDLNAPGGITDYCARYSGFYKRLAAEAAGPEVFDKPNLERVIAAWPHKATPERLSNRSQWRNRRLAALAAHKRNAAREGE